MVVGEVAESVDFLVIGGGPGGYTAAIRAAQLGRSVTLIDLKGAAGVGGTCLHVGCIPSKALIEVAESHSFLSNVGFGARNEIRDLSTFQDWKVGAVDRLASGVRNLLQSYEITIEEGRAHFQSAQRVALINGESPLRFLDFESAVIATGSTPVDLPDLPFDSVDVLDSAGLLALSEVPKTLAVIGGGYIGIELATAFAKLGSTVTIIESAGRVLSAFDPRITRPVERQLKVLGVTVLSAITSVERGKSAGTVQVRTSDAVLEVQAEKTAVVVGRFPSTADLSLNAAGIVADEHGLIRVDKSMQAAERICAVGDVTSGPALAHKASMQAIVAAEHLSGRRSAATAQVIPIVVYSDPQIAVVGSTAAQARIENLDVTEVTVPVGVSGRAATHGRSQGFLTMVAERASGVLVGVQIVAPNASEMISEAVVAIEMGSTAEDLVGCIHPHPTMSEMFAEAAGALIGAPLHLPRSRS